MRWVLSPAPLPTRTHTLTHTKQCTPPSPPLYYFMFSLSGEAAADALGVEPGPLPGFVSPCKELLVRFINTHFPTLRAQSAEGEGDAADA